MRNKQRIAQLEERIGELAMQLAQIDERLTAAITQQIGEHTAQTEGMTTSRMLNEWLNGEEGAHE